jgi:hypothetical protein
VLTFSEPRPTTRRLAQYAGTRTANDDGLRMREDGGNIEASYKNATSYQQQDKRTEFSRTWAFDVHEIGVGRLYKTFQLVLFRLGLSRGVEEIDGERLFDAR